MCFKRKGPVRLAKQRTYREIIQNWIKKNYWYLAIMGGIIVAILLVYLCLAFMPGTESGVYYNNRTGVI